MEQEKKEQKNIQHSVTKTIAKEQPWQGSWDVHLSVWESLPDIDLRKAYREPFGKVTVAMGAMGATVGLCSIYDQSKPMQQPLHPAVKLGTAAAAVAGSLGLCEWVTGKSTHNEQKTVWRRACDYVYADTGVMYPSTYYDSSLSKEDRAYSDEVIQANQKKLNKASFEGEYWKRTLGESKGQASLTVMALGVATGLYSLYAKFQKDTFGAPFVAHPAVALSGLAVAGAALFGFSLAVTEKALDKLEQEPRETVDSWANKVNALRAKEKEVTPEMVR